MDFQVDGKMSDNPEQSDQIFDDFKKNLTSLLDEEISKQRPDDKTEFWDGYDEALEWVKSVLEDD